MSLDVYRFILISMNGDRLSRRCVFRTHILMRGEKRTAIEREREREGETGREMPLSVVEWPVYSVIPFKSTCRILRAGEFGSQKIISRARYNNKLIILRN
jgi:hypothetical protein